jgi:hypothetical protein
MSNNMDMMSMMKSDQSNSKMMMASGNDSNAHSTMVSVYDYQSAQGLTVKAEEIFDKLLTAKAPSDKASAIAEVQSSLTQKMSC